MFTCPVVTQINNSVVIILLIRSSVCYQQDYVDEEAEAYPTNGAELPPDVHGWPAMPPGLVMPPVPRGRAPELPPRPPVPAVRPVRLPPYGSPGFVLFLSMTAL